MIGHGENGSYRNERFTSMLRGSGERRSRRAQAGAWPVPPSSRRPRWSSTASALAGCARTRLTWKRLGAARRRPVAADLEAPAENRSASAPLLAGLEADHDDAGIERQLRVHGAPLGIGHGLGVDLVSVCHDKSRRLFFCRRDLLRERSDRSHTRILSNSEKQEVLHMTIPQSVKGYVNLVFLHGSITI